jgi:2-polyprenyl-6-hydroxyphenyl methylase / 3-demethylubiquinone-9 3-methyltransferase
MSGLPVRARNDPRQYDDLAREWWRPDGAFAMLGWIADARIRHIPAARDGRDRLLDVACGGGLLAPRLTGLGYRHTGVDLTASALHQAVKHGVLGVQADAAKLPFADETFDVVVAGEILEHVTDFPAVVAEACRVLRTGGTLVIDTIADTWLARFIAITVGERIPGGAPPRLHDGALFVDRNRLRAEAARHGVSLSLNGLRPAAVEYTRWLFGRGGSVRMIRTRPTAVLFQAVGTKT